MSAFTVKLSRRNLLQAAGRTGMGMAALCCTAKLLISAEPKIVVPPYNTLSDAQEVELGKVFSGELEKKVQLIDIGPITSYLNEMVEQLARSSQRPNLQYPVKVVDTAQINAVSLPGGFIYVYRGLIEFVKDESELVGVLSHEVGHVVGHHAANAFCLNFTAKRLYDDVQRNLGLDNTVVAAIIERLGGPLAILAQLHYGRAQEFEADLLGVYQMHRAGWNPAGMLHFFTTLQAYEKPSLIGQFLSTHPPSSERATRVRNEIQQMPELTNLTDNSLKFVLMKGALQILPPPPKETRKS